MITYREFIDEVTSKPKHKYVSSVKFPDGTKAANIFQHTNGKFFASGGASSGLRKDTTFHDSADEASEAYLANQKKPEAKKTTTPKVSKASGIKIHVGDDDGHQITD